MAEETEPRHPGNQNQVASRTVRLTLEEEETRRLNRELADKIVWAKGEGHFFVAIWALEDDPANPGKKMVVPYFQRRAFPVGDYNICGRQLREWMQQDATRDMANRVAPPETQEEKAAE